MPEVRWPTTTRWISGGAVDLQFFGGVWGTSSRDGFTVDELGTILHYDGTAWSGRTSGTVAHLRGVWGSSSGDAVVVGDYGINLRGQR